MAPLDPNSTVRVYLDYTSAGKPHQAELRVSGLPTTATLTSIANSLKSVFTSYMFDADSVLGARYSPAFVDFSLPLSVTPAAGTLVTGFAAQWAEDKESAMLSWCGRGENTARRWRLSFFTPYAFAPTSVNWPTNNRYNPGDNSVVDTLRSSIISLLAASYSGSRIVNIAEDTVAMNAYTNISKNGYWQREQRT